MDSPQLLNANSADVRLDVQPEQLAVSFKRLGSNIRRRPVTLPPVNEFGHRRFRGINTFASGILRHQPGKLNFSRALCALEARIADTALAREGVGTNIEFDFPR